MIGAGKDPKNRLKGSELKAYGDSPYWARLAEKQVQPDPEAQEVLEDNLWDLVGDLTDVNGVRG